MMTRSPRYLLITAAWLLAASSLLCTISGTGEIEDEDALDSQEQANAFGTSNAQFTQTAEATEGSAVTATPPPTNTPEPTATLPDPLAILFEQSDPSGDTVNCLSNNPATDDGADIARVLIVEAPTSSGHDGPAAVIETHQSISEILATDFSFAVSISARQQDGSTTSFLFERHDNIDRIGQEDADHQVMPDTESVFPVDANSPVITVLLPPNTTKIDVFTFHTPSEDAPDDFFCDNLTNITIPNDN